jgi:uncharacterized protein YbjT (DUF2867 family)
MTITAFIAGATGYTGQQLTRQLAARKVRTVAHVRPDSSALSRLRSEFTAYGAQVDTTPWNEDALVKTLLALAPTHIFYVIGTTRKRGKEAAKNRGAVENYETVDYGLAAMLMRALARTTLKPRFIYLSSVGVSKNAKGGYLRARYKAEQELQASGLEWIIARPAFITGEEREEWRPAERIGGKLFDAVLSAVSALGAKDLANRYASLNSEQLARALIYFGIDAAGANVIVDAANLRAHAALL